jgi:hypothetical protein
MKDIAARAMKPPRKESETLLLRHRNARRRRWRDLLRQLRNRPTKGHTENPAKELELRGNSGVTKKVVERIFTTETLVQ